LQLYLIFRSCFKYFYNINPKKKGLSSIVHFFGLMVNFKILVVRVLVVKVMSFKEFAIFTYKKKDGGGMQLGVPFFAFIVDFKVLVRIIQVVKAMVLLVPLLDLGLILMFLLATLRAS